MTAPVTPPDQVGILFGDRTQVAPIGCWKDTDCNEWVIYSSPAHVAALLSVTQGENSRLEQLCNDYRETANHDAAEIGQLRKRLADFQRLTTERHESEVLAQQRDRGEINAARFDLEREREQHQQTQRELATARASLEDAIREVEDQREAAERWREETERWRDRCHEATATLEDVHGIARAMLRLSGRGDL